MPLPTQPQASAGGDQRGLWSTSAPQAGQGEAKPFAIGLGQ